MNCHFRYAKTVGAKHFHTSAKLNKGIEEMFFELSKRECSLVHVASFKEHGRCMFRCIHDNSQNC